ncbi:PAQR family membrane homeostasis protein TrhA [Colwellia psychrerythraea]|uniref:Channel protein, hemolysin III family n=1 Tax=Colwellia psychrerythraea TaxID=28229 RepID=A0A099KF03_COLPS|nr:hemolysin III family protein [Colwellia psychrerythraea]KGJ88941.1 channel protein, hemolysin III family [Colwellia psychrerythraea]
MTDPKDNSSATTTPAPYSQNEEKLNVLSHALGLLLSFIALFLLLKNSHGEFSRIVSFSIFATSGILLFLASTLYHSLTNKQVKQLFKLLDHCAIYLLIAGTYTPLLAITLAGPLGYTLLAFIWLFALFGILFKIKFGNKYKKTSLATYLGMGFISLGMLGELYEKLPEQAIGLLALGGLIYTLGVFFYVKKTVPYTHAIWHLFVLGGVTCHFLMIYWYV